MNRNFLAFFGHLNIDVTLRVDYLPIQGTVGINEFSENYGGTAGNFAMVASHLGVPFHLYSAISRRTHGKFLEFLENRGIDTAHLLIDETDYGPVCYAATTGKEQVYYIYQGPMDKPITDRIEFNARDYEYVHFGTGLPVDFVRISKNLNSSKIVFDPGQELAYRYNEASLKELLSKASLSILNESEADKAASILGIEMNALPGMTHSLIITKGQSGVKYYNGGKSIGYHSRKVENPFDTIGAGDSFRAGLYLGLMRGMEVRESIALGIIVASEAIKKPLTDFALSAEEIMEIYNDEYDDIIIR